MPDPSGKTISATQVPALFDASPYITRWLLWQHFRNGADIEVDANDRMDWGKRLEPVIFAATCDELNLDGEHHQEQTYFRHETLPIGCTPDGTIHDLNRGPGAVECKNVDWLQWRDNWTDEHAPDHIELQIQSQMLVRGQRWGVIACLVGGNDLRLYHREPDKGIHDRIAAEVEGFLASVKDGPEPDPLGRNAEMPLFRQINDPGNVESILDLKGSREAWSTLKKYDYWTGRESLAKKERAQWKNRLELLAKDHSAVIAHGIVAYLKRSQVNASEITLPQEIKDRLIDAANRIDDPAAIEAIRAAEAWSQITRRAGVQVRIDVKERPQDGDPEWDDLEDIFAEATEPN